MQKADISPIRNDIFVSTILIFLVSFSCLLSAQDTISTNNKADSNKLPPAYQHIKGQLLDKDSTALPFVNLYFKGSTKGTTTNEEGNFEIEVPTTNSELIVQCTGFKTLHLQINKADTFLLIILHGEHYELKAAEVNTNADLGYSIIKKAIARRKHHLGLVHAYSCDAYLKGVVRLTEIPKSIPFFIRKEDIPDSSNLGIVYLSESQSQLHVRYPNQAKEIMTASRVSGSSQAFSWNRTSDIRFNFYDNSVFFPFISKSPFVSPIANNALFYYKYKLEGAIIEGEQLINKIKVTSRRIGEPAFNGYIYIIDSTWQIHSLSLYLTKEVNINFVDTLHLDIQYVPLSDSVRMPLSVKFHAFYKAFGFGAQQTSIGFFSNYHINPSFPRHFFDNEVFKVSEEANQKDTSWWANTRPVLITEEERKNYRKNDSLESLRKSKPYLDSLDKIHNQFRLIQGFLTGYDYENSYRKWSIRMLPLISTIQANTVERATFNWGFSFNRYFENPDRTLGIEPVLRYGVSNNTLNVKTRISYISAKNPSYQLFLEGGKFVSQFNNRRPISPLLNTIYTELAEENYMKLYRKKYISAGITRELFNGCRITLQSEYAQRESLNNYTEAQPWIDYKNKTYSANAPSMPNHAAWNIEALVRFRLLQKYSLVGDYKVNHRSKYPTLYMLYRKGISGIAHSESNFDFLQVGVSEDLSLRLFGTTSIDVFAGTFLNSAAVFFPDYKHFNGNQTLWVNRNVERQPMNNCFQLLPYYDHSTISSFIQLHIEHDFGSFIMSKLPLIRRLHWENHGGINFLYSQGIKEHIELYVGFSRVLKFFRVDIVSIYNRTSKYQPSIRFGLDL